MIDHLLVPDPKRLLVIGIVVLPYISVNSVHDRIYDRADQEPQKKRRRVHTEQAVCLGFIKMTISPFKMTISPVKMTIRPVKITIRHGSHREQTGYKDRQQERDCADDHVMPKGSAGKHEEPAAKAPGRGSVPCREAQDAGSHRDIRNHGVGEMGKAQDLHHRNEQVRDRMTF